ncbi:MAG: MATE family efflux transporter, partial [Oscillospiraceae bacterium]|nr:MATE family efflux transporter [Oscillospiraceae bacterium]
STPPEVLPAASEYLRIFCAGLVGFTVYNAGAAILTALGDGRRPLYFLAISAVLNIVGDLLFVTVFHMGVAGVALATIFSEAVSAVLVLIVLADPDAPYSLRVKDLRLHASTLRGIARLGLPSAVQGTIISASNVVVQAYFNGLGPISLAGYSASSKLDAFIQLPVQTMAMVVATFVAQNLGARQVARARQGVRYAMAVGTGVTMLLSVLTLAFARPLLGIFSADPAVLDAGIQFMLVFAPSYFVLSFTQILPGALRGAGNVHFATWTCVTCFVVLRQIYLYFVTQSVNTITSVALAYPITWALAAVAICVYYTRNNWFAFDAPVPVDTNE